MNMKEVFLLAINGTFDLTDMLGKIDTHHIAGNLTDTDREELIRKAREKADPMGGVDIRSMLMEHEARIKDLEAQIKAGGNTTGSDPTGNDPTADVKAYEIGTWYKAGDLMRWIDGNIYRCIAKYGYIRAWSPADHPDSWELYSA